MISRSEVANSGPKLIVEEQKLVDCNIVCNNWINTPSAGVLMEGWCIMHYRLSALWEDNC